MGIQTEYNPDLALRNISEFKKGNRKLEECIPKEITKNQVYKFLKKGQRNFWLQGEIPLVETKGNQELSSPLASIVILESTHFLREGEPYTKGLYKIVDIFDPNDTRIHFNGFERVYYYSKVFY